MFNESALISNTLWEEKIAANNAANAQLKTVCSQPWAQDLPTLTSMTHFVANADIEITFNGDFETIWAAVPDKVNVYYLAVGADDCGRSPDYDGDKLDKLVARYIDRKAEDFTCANVQMEFKTETPMMMFYSQVDGIKVCWKVAMTREEYQAKYQAQKINDVSYSNGDYYALLSI